MTSRCTLPPRTWLLQPVRRSYRQSSTTATTVAGVLKKPAKAYEAIYPKVDLPQVVILGGGWAGFQLAQDLKKQKYDVTLVSPRNHFLFTPLLPSTTVGTLEFRCIQEPVRTIKDLTYYQAAAKEIDVEAKEVVCSEVFHAEDFRVKYDYLVIACGAENNTFGVPGVSEENNVFFLKQLADARKIRSLIIENFERASYPGLTDNDKKKLLSFVVVGGGPTSVEFTSELHDFLKKDVHRWYQDLEHLVTVTLIEASSHIMGSFDTKLVEYTTKTFEARKIKTMVNASVAKVEKNKCFLKDGQEVDFGLMVWSTGNKAVPFIEKLPLQKGKGNRLVLDSRLRVIGLEDKGVFAMGDCGTPQETILPQLAQVAQQEAKYLAQIFNKYDEPATNPAVPKFEYRHMLSMSSLGMWKGVVDAGKVEAEGKKTRGAVVTGFAAFVLWRSAYLTKAVSIQNKLLIPMHWFKSWIFGRDISKF